MSPVSPDTIAIVLAGGRSQRMAGSVPAGGKAAIPLGEDTMLARICSVLQADVARVIVVAASGQSLPPLPDGVEVTRDSAPDHGPLAAIRDGFAYGLAGGHPPAIAVVCSCDVPDLAPAVVRLLIEKARTSGAAWVVPIVGGHPQVLVSAMSGTLGEQIASDDLAGMKSPRRFLETLRADEPGRVLFLEEADLTVVDPSLASFADIDTPEDLVMRSGGLGR